MSASTEDKAVRVLIKGRVQGVWFRAWTKQEAESLGLDGWVRNRADGRVEAVFAGPPAAVDAMVEACRRGPSAARVGHVEVRDETEFVPPGFQLLDTL